MSHPSCRPSDGAEVAVAVAVVVVVAVAVVVVVVVVVEFASRPAQIWGPLPIDLFVGCIYTVEARNSLAETVGAVDLAAAIGVIREEDADAIQALGSRVRRMLTALLR